MVTRAELIAEALTWEHTPFHWQQCVKGRASDCFGWIWGTARELGMPEAAHFDYRTQNYRRGFDPQILLDGLERALRPVDTPQPGDLIAYRWLHGEELPRHLAMLISDRHILHSYGKGPKRVIRAARGQSRPVHSYWTWPSLQGA